MDKLVLIFVVLFLGAIALGACAAAIQRLRVGGDGAYYIPEGRYTKQSFVLTKAELSFLSVLDSVVPAHTRVFPQVLLRLIISATRDAETYRRDQNQINQKYVDFLVCDEWSRPLLVIELNDFSHNYPRRRDRDDFLEAALASAGIPLLREPARSQYNAETLRGKIAALLAGVETPV